MITELESMPDIWRRMPSETHARRFLEGRIWKTDRHCLHCGSVRSTALRGRVCISAGTAGAGEHALRAFEIAKQKSGYTKPLADR